MLEPINRDGVLQFIRGSLQGYAIAQFPEYRPGKHHKLLASKLEDVEAGRIKRLAVLMAPRHGKSKLSSELFPSWFLGRNPTRRVLSLSYGQDLADVFGRSVRNYIKTPTFQSLFPECQLASDSSSVRRFNTTAGGGYFAIGAGAGITGRGADVIVLDDLIKDREQADSPVYRESLIDWYKSVARTRLQPNGAIVLVQTRWSTTDFVAWLLAETAHENWEVISLPAIALESDPLGRLPGEPLWAEAYPLAALEQIRETLGSRDWSALYQQCPLSDSDVIFRQNWLKFYTNSPLERQPMADLLGLPESDFQIIASWDLTFGGTGQRGSWVVGQVWAQDRESNFIYLIDQYRQQVGFIDSCQAIVEMNEKHKPSHTLVEAKANGAGVIEVLRATIPNLTAIEPQGGKEDRAYRITPMFERGEVFLPDPKTHSWVKPLLSEMQSFPQSVTDDCIDAMTQALGYLKYDLHEWLKIFKLS